MPYLIDTDLLSELRKGARANSRVRAWFRSIEPNDVYLSVMTMGEIRMGVDRLASREPQRAAELSRWLSGLTRDYSDRLLPIDEEVADDWGRLEARRTIGVVDALLAATARAKHLTLVTRNTRHYAGLGVDLINPFE